MTPSPTFTRVTAAVLAVVSFGACEIVQLAEQAGSKQVAVGTLLATPETYVPAAAFSVEDYLEGHSDGGIPDLDAGITLPAFTAAHVFFGQRQGESLDSTPIGTTGATGTLVQEGGPTFPLEELGEGNYALALDAGVTYVNDASYRFEFRHNGQTYVTGVRDAPPRENIRQLHPEKGFIEMDAMTTLTLTRPDPSLDDDRDIAFVNVFRVAGDGQDQTPTWTNIPSDATGLIKLVVAPNDWKRTTVVIPQTAFPNRDETYVVMLMTAKIGLPQTKNLFSASAVIAGAADIGIVKTRP
ncbi:MAG: hypothetical protein ACO1OB_26815 [Archangium sp.]